MDTDAEASWTMRTSFRVLSSDKGIDETFTSAGKAAGNESGVLRASADSSSATLARSVTLSRSFSLSSMKVRADGFPDVDDKGVCVSSRETSGSSSMEAEACSLDDTEDTDDADDDAGPDEAPLLSLLVQTGLVGKLA